MPDQFQDDLFDEPIDDGAELPPGDDLPLEDLDGDGDGQSLSDKMYEVAELLAANDYVIDVDEAMTPEEFLDHLCTAVRTKQQADGEEPPPEDGDDLAAPESEPVEEPQMISMSRRLKHLERDNARLRSSHAEDKARLVEVEIDDLLAQGRCTPKQARDWKTRLRTEPVRMSLVGDRKDPALVSVVAQIVMARDLPEGTYRPAKPQKAGPAPKPGAARLSHAGQRVEEPTPPDLGSTEDSRKAGTNALILAAGLRLPTNGK